MNPSAIYSKSGKGVQEASGKTSLLSRPDRAVLSAIDGRATLADVAQKVGKSFDPAFEKLIETLDKGGFIREVSPGTAAPGKPGAGAKPGGKPGATAPMDAASDLDFTASIMPGKAKPQPPPQAPPRAAPPPPRHTATIPPAPPPPSAEEKVKAERIAKEQQDAFVKAREEAERKAAAERERVKAEAEAKLRAETETKLRAEAEAKARADAEKKLAAEAEAKVKAAREAAVKAAAEAKAKAEAEAKKAREEAERARKEAEEKAERARKEAEEKARREQEELRRKLEEERKAREEAERKAKEEARRLEEERRQLEEERKRHEEERKRHEEAKRREEEERTQRRIQEERERVERKRREREEEEEERKQKTQEEPRPKAKEPEPARAAAPSGGGFSDSLLADLESFNTREETEQKEKEETERKAKEEAARRAKEEAERREREEAERREREDRERDKQREKEEAAARKRAEERELREREEREKARLKEEEEKRKKEAEERERKAKQEERATAKATRGEGFSEEEALRRRRERQLGPSTHTAAAKERAARGGWGKPIAIALFLLLAVGLGVAHIMPIDVTDYRAAAEEALGRPVKIGSARLSLISGLQLKFSDVVVGETRVAEVRAFPEFDALTGPNKRFSRIEIDGIKLGQEALGEALFAKVKGDNFSVARVVAKQVELIGPLALPKGLEFDASFDAAGMVRSATVRGPEALIVKLARKESATDIDMSAATFALPFAPEISLSKFGLKGAVTPRGMSVSEWDGQLLNGTVSGTANVRWGETWVVDGVLTARSINAAVFAPALLSDGRGEGSGKFSMRGDPGKLAASARLDGSFTITRGVLGTIDLSRAIQTGGKQATGRTQFNELNGQAVYDRGAVALRNITLSAGQLNAGASADISQSGALSGRIVADVKVSSQILRATLNLGGTLKEPQVRN